MRRPIKKLKKLKKYWKKLQLFQDRFHMEIHYLEKQMEEDTGIKGIEFFFCDGYCGIGTVDRKMKLVHDHELEETC